MSFGYYFEVLIHNYTFEDFLVIRCRHRGNIMKIHLLLYQNFHLTQIILSHTFVNQVDLRFVKVMFLHLGAFSIKD